MTADCLIRDSTTLGDSIAILPQDLRYKDRTWVRGTRRWPPRLVDELEAFLDVKATSK